VGGCGSLTIDGYPCGVVLTSDHRSPANGDWKGIAVGSKDDASFIFDMTIEHAGANTKGNVYFAGAVGDPSISGSTVNDSSTRGIYCDSAVTLGSVNYSGHLK
jgi:hypothetical protein